MFSSAPRKTAGVNHKSNVTWTPLTVYVLETLNNFSRNNRLHIKYRRQNCLAGQISIPARFIVTFEHNPLKYSKELSRKKLRMSKHIRH